MPLRTKAGGYHAKSRLGCYLFSCCMVFFLCMMNKNEVFHWIEILKLFVSDIGICILAPVENENRTLYECEKKQFKRQAIGIMIGFNIVILFTLLNYVDIACYLINGIGLAFLLCGIGKIDELAKSKKNTF